MQNKKLYRSNENKILFGVLGGIGEYLEKDPALVRVVFIFLSMFVLFYPSVIAYLIFLFIIPKKPSKKLEEVKKDIKEEIKTETKE